MCALRPHCDEWQRAARTLELERLRVAKFRPKRATSPERDSVAKLSPLLESDGLPLRVSQLEEGHQAKKEENQARNWTRNRAPKSRSYSCSEQAQRNLEWLDLRHRAHVSMSRVFHSDSDQPCGAPRHFKEFEGRRSGAADHQTKDMLLAAHECYLELDCYMAMSISPARDGQKSQTSRQNSI